MDPAERALVESIEQERVREDLEALVRIPSVTGSEEAIQAEVARRLEEAGFEVSSFSVDPREIALDPDFPGAEVERSTLPIVAARLPAGASAGGGPPTRRLIVCGHVDVVPVGDEAAWRSPPFDPVVRDGLLYGRGACDMKGGLAAALAAMRALAAVPDGVAGDGVTGEAIFLSVPSEEDGGSGMLAAIRAGYTADLAVITEPTRLDIVTTQAGAITFRLTVTGRAAHASMRRQGVSALEKLFLLTRALEEDEAARNAAETRPEMRALGLPYPTIIGKVSGGEWASTVMDRLVAEGRYGVQAGETAAEAEHRLRDVIAAVSERDDWLRDHPPSLEISGGRFSSAIVPQDHPLPVSLADAAAAVLGRRPAFAGVPYGADMRLLVDEGRTPTVIFGPGDPALAHTANESVPLAEVVDCAAVLAVWIRRELMGAARPD